MAIKSTTNAPALAKPEVKPFPKLMVVKQGITLAGSVFLFKSPKEATLVFKGSNFIKMGDHFAGCNPDDYEDFNDEITLKNL